MQAGKEYIIQFVGLSLGEHRFDFEVKDKFFENLEFSEIKHAAIHVKLNLLKQSQMMVLHFEIGGTVKTLCDLCASEFDLPIHGDYKLIVKVGGSDTGNEDDDIITVAANEHQLDLSTYLYEYITLSLPIKRVHPLDKDGNSTCDIETLKKLENFIVEEAPETEEEIDPRWDGLKNIKLN
ncbi:MAG: YceD family protein [Bacteroidia bacterium]